MKLTASPNSPFQNVALKKTYFCLFPNCHKISVCKIVQLIVDSCHEKKGLENSLEQTFADLSTEAVLRPVQCLDHAGHKL